MRTAVLILAITAAFTAGAESVLALQRVEPQDTVRKEIRIIEPDGRDLTISMDEEGRIVIDGLELDEHELSIEALRRALARRDGRARAFAFRGDFPDPAILAERLGDRFHPRLHPDSLVIDLEDLRLFHLLPGARRAILGLPFGGGDEVEAQREIAEMEIEARRLAKEVRKAQGPERAELEARLDNRLSELFELRQELRSRRVERLEEEVERERSQLAERQANRRDVIERRKRELLGERDRLDW